MVVVNRRKFHRVVVVHTRKEEERGPESAYVCAFRAAQMKWIGEVILIIASSRAHNTQITC